MYRATEKSTQVNLFTSGGSMLRGKSLSLYEDEQSWHNMFRKQITMQIDEDLFKVLYNSRYGTPNASIRVLVAMMILKEAEGMSDERLFENCRFNMLTRSAFGLMNVDESVPTESTYYLFRKNVKDYQKHEKGENLFEKVFSSITNKQSLEFNVSGKRIRMDSKLMGSNIAWLSRYELIHETIRVFYKNCKSCNHLKKEIQEKLEEVLQVKGNKVVYTSTSNEIKTKIQELGELMYALLNLTSKVESSSQTTFSRVFHEQFELDEDKIVVARRKEEISAKSIQSPHDPDSHFRNKDGNKVKGYTMNLTESCDDQGLNLVSNVSVKPVTASDVYFLQEGIKKSEEVFEDKAENVHVDGAYHSPDNQDYCTKNNMSLQLHAIQGAKGRYELEISKSSELIIFDTKTKQNIEYVKRTGKSNVEKWRIKTEKGYRYFTQKQIETSRIRKKIEQAPTETLQKRNNVEASIFQLGYHYPNAKTRYRGLIKHQMWANIRCLWMNFVRVLNFKSKIIPNTLHSSLIRQFHLFFALFLSLEDILKPKKLKNLSVFNKPTFNNF